jgi:hypothetical protein
MPTEAAVAEALAHDLVGVVAADVLEKERVVKVADHPADIRGSGGNGGY